jgi:hypothetical protein
MHESDEQEGPVVETIEHGGRILAKILRDGGNARGIHFITEDDYTQQVGLMRHPPGKLIQPHVHNPVHRNVTDTSEVLFVKRGRLRVDFYDDDRNYLESRVLGPLDTLLLIRGGHGFECLEALEMIEVKQGPYVGTRDKTTFERQPIERTLKGLDR